MRQRISKDLITRRYDEHLKGFPYDDGVEATFWMGLQLLVYYDLIDTETFKKRLLMFERGIYGAINESR